MLKVGNLYRITCNTEHPLLVHPKQDDPILIDSDIEDWIGNNSIVMYLGWIRHNFRTYYEFLHLNQVYYIASHQLDKPVQFIEVKP